MSEFVVELAAPLVLAALAGAAVSYLSFALPLRSRADRLAVSADRIPGLENENGDLRERAERLGAEKTRLEATLDSERRQHAARIEELTRMGDELDRKFKLLAADALGANSESFMKLVTERFEKHAEKANDDLDRRRREIDTLVKPLGESLEKFERRIGEIEKAREGAYSAISEQVRNLAEGQSVLKSETTRLVQALRQPRTRGRWGEYQLRNVLEMAGMTEHVDFVEQPTLEGEDGRLRPDVIIRVPGGKSIIVDAKTPLEAYLEAIEVTDESERGKLLSDHARQVQDHIRILASRDYWKSLSETPDFVVMFVPGEAFFAAAIENKPDLFENAVKQRVLISTPTTFIALVKAIAYGWQQEKLAENAQAVRKLGLDLFERIRVFGGHMDRLGQSLKQAVDRYNMGIGSLEGRVLPAARRFEALGIAEPGASIPVVEQVEVEARRVQAEELTETAAGMDQDS